MFKVTKKAMRPASTKEACFYCHEPMGATHKDDCVLIRKKVKIRMVIEYEEEFPNHWKKEDVEFHRNEGSWCADNAITELEYLSEKEGCLCNTNIKFEYLEDTSEAYLEEG